MGRGSRRSSTSASSSPTRSAWSRRTPRYGRALPLLIVAVMETTRVPLVWLDGSSQAVRHALWLHHHGRDLRLDVRGHVDGLRALHPSASDGRARRPRRSRRGQRRRPMTRTRWWRSRRRRSTSAGTLVAELAKRTTDCARQRARTGDMPWPLQGQAGHLRLPEQAANDAGQRDGDRRREADRTLTRRRRRKPASPTPRPSLKSSSRLTA